MDGLAPDPPLQRRLATLGRLDLLESPTSARPPLADLIVSKVSLAGSPTYGAIYLNTSNRFMDGIVAPPRADDIAKTVFSALKTSIVKRLQLDLDIWSSHVVCPPAQRPPDYVMHYRWHTGKMHMAASRPYAGPDRRTLHPAVPDFMIHVPGVELSDSGPSLFDPNSHPCSTHHPRGFALFLGKDVLTDGAIRPTQLNAMLESFLA